MKYSRRSTWLVAGLFAVLLQACGGGGSDSTGNASVRFINATQTHASLDLLAGSTTIISATAQDTASTAVSQTAGSITIQANDAGDTTSLTSTTMALGKDLHYSVLAYESGGSVKLALLGEDLAVPTTGSAVLRLYNAGNTAGTFDVYVTATDTDLSTVSAPTITTTSTAPAYLVGSFTPGTYRVRITAAGAKSDLRLDIPSFTLSDQQTATVILTPSAGGSLVNGGLMVQQGSFSAYRNTSARVRLAAAVSGNALVTASAGSSVIESGVVAPAIGPYVTVPVASALAVSINGAPQSTSLALTAGTDVTLMVHGAPGAATVSAIVDDNLLPASAANLKLRLVNGLTGAPIGLSLYADFGLLASNVQPAQASVASVLAGSTSMQVEAKSAVTQQSVFLNTALNLPGSRVYTLFLLGDSAAPVGLLSKDRGG